MGSLQAALLTGRISTRAVAAHQIALQVATLLYMVPFGIALAATVRVGQAAGRRDAAAFMAVMTLIIAAIRHAIPQAFLGADAPQSTETIELAAALLVVGASFFVSDGLQARRSAAWP